MISCARSLGVGLDLSCGYFVTYGFCASLARSSSSLPSALSRAKRRRSLIVVVTTRVRFTQLRSQRRLTLPYHIYLHMPCIRSLGRKCMLPERISFLKKTRQRSGQIPLQQMSDADVRRHGRSVPCVIIVIGPRATSTTAGLDATPSLVFICAVLILALL